MKHQSKFLPKQEQAAQQAGLQSDAAKEFAQPDELLRFDAAHTLAPPELAQRLQKSSAQIRPPNRRPWWKSWLGQ